MKNLKKLLLTLLCIGLMGISCKKDTKNIDKAVGRWTISRYNDVGLKLNVYYIDITKIGESLNGTITDCLECASTPYFVDKMSFSKDNISFSYQLISGFINVNASLKDDKTIEGSWSDQAGNTGDWIANK